jgi:glycosyltransferase involved in cell wall biosynthesis
MDSQDPVFVIPSFIGSRRDLEIFGETLESLVGQSDTRWRAVIVDDDSTFAWTEQDLDGFDPQRMHVVRRSSNTGPGECRNVGVGRAAGAGAPFVLFQDADDLAHPDRLRSARRVFEEEPETDFLYSAFDVIGEHGEPVPRDEISGSVLEIIDSHDNPVEGRDAWIPVATETGYTTLTSTVAVRTELALRHPFPACHASEDTHAWLRMMADGGELRFVGGVRAGYRIRGGEHGSASRERQGESFYWSMLQVDLDGFVKAMNSALEQGRIKAEQCPDLLRDYHLKQAETMESEGLAAAAGLCRSLAAVSAGAGSSSPVGHGE